ncbi:Uncharacterised protein [Chlamydia trachomatis]|nr:Uncharacterised protein [Chlamydia trachomatis]
MRSFAVKRALIHYSRLAFWVIVHNHRAMLNMLAWVNKIHAKHVQIALFAAKILIHADSHNVSAKRDHCVTERSTLPNVNPMISNVLAA